MSEGGNKIAREWSSADWYTKERSTRAWYIIGAVVALVVVVSAAAVFVMTRPKAVLKQMSTYYLPEYFSNLHLGMSGADFARVKENANIKLPLYDFFPFRIELVEQVNKEGIDSVTYYLDNEGDKPLYELIIEYSPIHEGLWDSLQSHIAAKYGAPNHGDEWRFDSQEGFRIMIWTFDSKLVIAGAIRDTEWENAI